MENLDRVIKRRGSDCVKWDCVPEDVIPMWVADMDFEVAPCIQEAIRRRAEHPVFGYTAVPQRYYETVCNWFATYHGWRPDPSWILYTIGVVPAISACIEAFTHPGDKVILMSPVYNCFFSSVRNYGCVLEDVPLRTEDAGGRPRYVIDFEALERAAADPASRVMLICSPHNPAGRLWTREELERVGRICLAHDVIPVVDEIHCEFVPEGSRPFVPFASVDPEFERRSVILGSASKAFNIAGLQIANIICADADMRARIDKALNVNEICDVNPFGVVALQAAYSPEGHDWLDAMNRQVRANYEYQLDLFTKELPELPLYRMEATYLSWLHVKALCYGPDGSLRMSSQQITDSLTAVEKVRLNAGSMYGSEGFLRFNLACPPALLEEGLARAVRGLRRMLK